MGEPEAWQRAGRRAATYYTYYTCDNSQQTSHRDWFGHHVR